MHKPAAFLFAMTVISGTALAGEYHAIYRFTGQPDGAYPEAGLVMDAQGRLYGTTNGGGAYNLGTVFRLTPPSSHQGQWSEEILHSFSGPDGDSPVAAVTLGPDGSVYGTATFGGLPYPTVSGHGTVFKLANVAGWPLTVLHAFTRAEGGFPESAVMFGQDGLLYGVTPSNGQTKSYADFGTSYSLSPLGDQVEYRVTHLFEKHAGEGESPVGLAVVPPAFLDGFVGANSYGSTIADQFGTVFSLKLGSANHTSESTLYSFGLPPDVSHPVEPPLVGRVAIGNTLFGCASMEGLYNHGGIYSLGRGAFDQFTETVIYSFGAKQDDPVPGKGFGGCSLVQADEAGKLYGTTLYGGSGGQGTFFELDPPTRPGAAWTESVDVSFSPTGEGGYSPLGTPLRHGAIYYGTAASLPNAGGYGTVYALTP